MKDFCENNDDIILAFKDWVAEMVVSGRMLRADKSTLEEWLSENFPNLSDCASDFWEKLGDIHGADFLEF